MSEDKKKLLGDILLDKQIIKENEAAAALNESDDKKKRLGQILVEQKVITESELQASLEEQKSSARRLGDILTARGFASQKDIIRAFSIQLQQRLEEGQPAAAPGLLNRIRYTRISIRVRLAIFITLLVVIIMSVASSFFFRTQKEEFVNQTIRFGSTLVTNLSHNSSVPLLEKDEASLHILIEDISKTEDIAYVLVLDRAGVIKAHSDISKIDRTYAPVPRAVPVTKNDTIEIVKFREGKHEVLDISSPVAFNKVALGTVHVGISLESLQKKIARSGLFVLIFTGILIAIGVGVSLYISTQFSRPIYNLLHGTAEISNGNFAFRTKRLRNDELGDLTIAFNDMAEGLRKKEVIQDAFGKYVNPEIVDMILQNPDGKWFQGKKIPATIMFTDIRGFTTFSEKNSPEDVVAVLNEHFTTATEIILRHGGHIDKFIGDAVLVVFGALMEYDDHAERAVRAAVSLQEALARNVADDGWKLQIGIGINTGEVIAGNIGSQKRMEYTVIGDTVNLASRLTGIAGPGEIIVSSATYYAVGVPLKAVKRDPVSVKGKMEPVETFLVEGIGGELG